MITGHESVPFLFPWELDQKKIIALSKPTPVDVPMADLNVDYTYQALAPRNPKLIKEIARAPDMAQFGRLRVARRPSGALYVFDGRHRLEGLRASGLNITLPCDIYDVPSIRREIELFVACNTRIRKVPQGMLFMAEVAAGDAEAVQLNRLVQEAGLAIVDANSAKQEFSVPKLACIGALKSLYGHGSPSYARRATAVPPSTLSEALELIREIAPPNALVTEHATLGFVWLVKNFPNIRDHGKRLQDIGWQRIDAAARSVGPRPKADDAGKALLSVIDFRRPANARLAPHLPQQAPPEGLPPMARAAA